MATKRIDIDEVWVRKLPPTMEKATAVRRVAWNRRMATLAFKKLRRRIIEKYGVDLVQAIPMDDCIEIRFKASVECMVIEKKKKGPRRFFSPDEIRRIRENDWDEGQVQIFLGKKVPGAVVTGIKNRNFYKDIE